MPIDRCALAAAVSEHVAPEVAERLADAWDTFSPKPGFDDDDMSAARAVALAISNIPAVFAAHQLDQLSLTATRLECGGKVTLTPAESLNHPLLVGWIGSTFVDAIAEAISAGRMATILASNAPIFRRFELFERGGVIVAGAAFLTFEQARAPTEVSVIYGDAAMFGSGFLRVNALGGDAAYNLGVALRSYVVEGIESPPVDSPPIRGEMH